MVFAEGGQAQHVTPRATQPACTPRQIYKDAKAANRACDRLTTGTRLLLTLHELRCWQLDCLHTSATWHTPPCCPARSPRPPPTCSTLLTSFAAVWWSSCASWSGEFTTYPMTDGRDWAGTCDGPLVCCNVLEPDPLSQAHAHSIT